MYIIVTRCQTAMTWKVSFCWWCL